MHDPYNPIDGTDQQFRSVTKNQEQQKFLATLQELDNQIGRFLGALKSMGVLENTLIFLTSDNGPTDWPRYYKDGGEPPCSAGDLRGRKWSLYDGGTRVPFIAVWPGHIPAGKVNSTHVMSVVDLVPTITKLTGSQTPTDFISDGIDESGVLLGKKQTTQKDLYWYYNNNPVPGKQENISPTLAIRSGQWKLLMEPDGTKKQLYNLEKDHRETINLVSKEPKLTAALTSKLYSWYSAYVK